LEAGLCKIPVVATNTEGIPEVVIHRETGLLGMPYDHIGLAKNLLELLTNESLSIKLGNQGRKYVIDNYLISEMKDNYLEFYKKMINKNSIS
jgi:glycosyltransferase involved in cell wall biosynthesis